MGGVRVAEVLAAQLDDDQERTGRLLLLAKGVVLALRLASPPAAELNETQQRSRSTETPTA